jgi:hypothetical protein
MLFDLQLGIAGAAILLHPACADMGVLVVSRRRHPRLPAKRTPHRITMAFKKLFITAAKPTDGMTQVAREAIVDLLHFGVYTDKHISLSEDKMIEATARTLNWDPNISFDYYEGKSIGEVRRVGNDEKERAEFFRSIRERLPKQADRALAFSLVKQLYAIDGMSDSESATLPAIRHELELK